MLKNRAASAIPFSRVESVDIFISVLYKVELCQRPGTNGAAAGLSPAGTKGAYVCPDSIYLTVSLPSDKLCKIPENPENEGLSSLFFFLASYPKMLPNAEMKIAKKILGIS